MSKSTSQVAREAWIDANPEEALEHRKAVNDWKREVRKLKEEGVTSLPERPSINANRVLGDQDAGNDEATGETFGYDDFAIVASNPVETTAPVETVDDSTCSCCSRWMSMVRLFPLASLPR